MCCVVPWCTFPAGTGREMYPDGLDELVLSSPLCLVKGRRSLPPPASSPPSSSLFCHFVPLMVEGNVHIYAAVHAEHRISEMSYREKAPSTLVLIVKHY